MSLGRAWCSPTDAWLDKSFGDEGLVPFPVLCYRFATMGLSVFDTFLASGNGNSVSIVFAVHLDALQLIMALMLTLH